MNIYEKLAKIQQKLKAPKGQYNSFGKYKYRNCEDILEALKPVCIERGCVAFLSDEIVTVGERNYVKATATLVDFETGEMVQNTAFAREEESKKGMDGSQVTGASSSYARKYALNGLFGIDDTKDSDTTNEHGKGNAEPKEDKPKIKTEPPICTECGVVIEGMNNKHGVFVPAETLYQDFGGMCIDCWKKNNDGN